MRRRKAAVAGCCVALAVLAAAASGPISRLKVPTRHLAGHDLRLEKVSYRDLSAPDVRTPLEKLAGNLVFARSPGWRSHRGVLPTPVTPGSLCVWTSASGRWRPNLDGPVSGYLVDEHGWTSAHVQAYAFVLAGGLQRWMFRTYPRHAQNLRLRVESDGSTVEFPLPPPPAISYPEWEPEPLPARRVDRGLSVQLLKVETGLPSPPLPDSRPPSPHSRFRFRVAGKGVLAPRWRVEFVTFTDATGNLWEGGATSRQDPNGELVAECNFSPEEFEREWKVRVRLRQDPGVQRLDGVMQRIPLPDTGGTCSFPASLQLGNQRVRLESVAERTQEFRLRPERRRGYELRGRISDTRRLPAVVLSADDQGRKLAWCVPVQLGAPDPETREGPFGIRFSTDPDARFVSMVLRSDASVERETAPTREVEFAVASSARLVSRR